MANRITQMVIAAIVRESIERAFARGVDRMLAGGGLENKPPAKPAISGVATIANPDVRRSWGA